MAPEFEARKIVITGAAGIYGRELSHALASAGSILCLSDVRAEALRQLASELGLPKERTMIHATDLCSEDSMADLIRTVDEAWRAPDVVINNAGIYPFAGLLDTDPALWDRIMGVNLRAPFLLMQAFARQMIDNGVKGSFINVTSGAADILRTNGVPYCVSKRALEYLSRGFALDLAGHGIRVNCVRPGFAAESALADFPPGYVEAMSRANPMGRLSRPGDLAAAVMFLSSSHAEAITGECLAVDGGNSIPKRPGTATPATEEKKASPAD